MLLKELKEKNSDIIKEELGWEDLPPLANGAALFYVSLAGSSSVKDDKRVLWAGQVMTVGMRDTVDVRGCQELLFLRTTAGGNPTLDSVHVNDLRADGRGALFYTRPMTADDRRNMKSFTEWK